MRNALKSLIIVLGCFMASATWAVTIYQTDLIGNPSGATTSGNKGEFTSAPSWASPYANCYHTTGSAGAVTITFTTPLDLSAYTNRKFNLVWGAESNRPVNLTINGGSATQIDAVAASSERSKVRTATADLSVTSISSIKLSGSGGGNSYYFHIEITGDAAGPIGVTGVSLSSSSETLEVNQTVQLTATVAPSNADNQAVTWSSSNNNIATVTDEGLVTAIGAGTATITVTTEDGSKTATCTITVTTPPDPIPVTAISLSNASVAIGNTKTLTVTYTPADANTGKAISTWTSSNTAVATVANGVVTGVSAGTATITATTEGGITASCTVTVSVVSVTGVSLDKSSADLQIGGTTTLTATVAPADASNKTVTWSSSNPAVATVANGVVTGIAAGTATITATTVDGNKTATCTVTVTAGPPVPSTTLSLHVPEIYEAKEIAGGYNTPLAVVGGREYEVFYINRDNSSNLTIATSNADKAGNICDDSGTSNTAKTRDGWLTISCSGTGGDTNAGARDEFQASIRSAKFNSSSHVMEMHIQGYDQFSFYGNDNNQDASKNKMFELYIDGVKQTRTPKAYSINRFDISSGEHVIKLTAIGGSDSKLCSFSLRVSQEPRTKYLKGNDSTQVVMQTAAIKPVYYVTKYNNIPGAVTELEWDGPAATGIELTKIDGTLTDTLVLSGNANCATGVYKYAVVAKYNGVETSRAKGTFTVKSDIKATSNIVVDVYNNEMMDQITFKYYALSADDVQLTWPNGQPTGISGSGNNGKYIIGGTPTLTGTFPQTFPYTITVTGADTIISGKITIKELIYTDKSVLYLYKNNLAYEDDDVHNYLKTKGWNLIERKALETGLRPSDQYANYKWIVISEDADADNKEVLGVMLNGANLPVLNLKGFTYAYQINEDTPNGWGEPDNGAIDTTQTKKGCKIRIEQPTHPVFSKMTSVAKNAEIAILSGYKQHGVMPIKVTRPGTLCLATGYTRSQEDYYQAGELQTAIHEVPASMNGGKKYICLPLARTAELSADGRKLIDGIVAYLTSDTQSSVEVPTCRITKFSVEGIEGVIDDAAHTIVVNMSVDEYQAADSLRESEPTIVLADPLNTHVVSDSKELRYAAIGLPKKYTVTDYITQTVYEVSIRLYTPQGIEETYESGMWVNIFDIYGRKVATTNEDIYTMDLPRGMYIVVTENGSTLKIMR